MSELIEYGVTYRNTNTLLQSESVYPHRVVFHFETWPSDRRFRCDKHIDKEAVLKGTCCCCTGIEVAGCTEINGMLRMIPQWVSVNKTHLWTLPSAHEVWFYLSSCANSEMDARKTFSCDSWYTRRRQMRDMWYQDVAPLRWSSFSTTLRTPFLSLRTVSSNLQILNESVNHFDEYDVRTANFGTYCTVGVPYIEWKDKRNW